MLAFAVRRVLSASVILAMVSVVAFALFFALPGDPAAIICGKGCTPQKLDDIRAGLGLDDPILVQYWDFMRGIFLGREFTKAGETISCDVPCLGFSYANSEPVWGTILDRFPATISLALGAAVLFLIVGIGLGAVAALRAQSWFDRAAIAFGLVGASVQIFVLGPVLNNLLVREWGILPTPRYVPLTDNPFDWFRGLLLPWIVLAFVSIAIYSRLTRAQMLEALGEDFVRAGRSRGVPARTLHLKHTGRATISPVITVFGLDLAGLLSGALITETVFNIQGLGRLAITAVNNYDLPMIMATVLIGATIILIFNVIVDILYAVIDPRVRIV